MNEYVISFINDNGAYQQLTFRGVSEAVATGLATGLLAAGFQEVSLSAKVDQEINLLEGVVAPDPAEGSGP